MGSSDKHKVCFEVLGVPVIIRAIETYNLCSSLLNLVVVGMKAETVMATVNARFPGTIYALQEQPRGTGDAARRGAEMLERLGYDGEVLVVAGDKVIEPGVIRRLLATHRKTGADVTLATAKRPPHSSTGILLKSPRGNIVGILEEAERQRLLALAELDQVFQTKTKLSPALVRSIVARNCTAKMATALLLRLLPDGESVAPLTRAQFEQCFTPEERRGRLKIGRLAVPAQEILERSDQMNLSTYLFRAPVLYDALHRLKPARNNQEEYLTDVFEVLARGQHPARVVGCEIHDLNDIMAFNNPQELLAIEEVYRTKQEPVAVQASPTASRTLALPQAWANLLAAPGTTARRQFRHWYGEDVPAASVQAVLDAFIRRHGSDRPVAIIRSPGRINLLGRHIDHQGGTVNVMAINREIFMVAAPRSDDRVTLANTNESQFAGQEFRISDLVASLDWDDWQHVIDGPRIQRMLEAARGDWANYIKAAILRLQELFRDRRLRGLDLMVGGDIPMGAGLSSSSALVVATAEAITAFNQLAVSARRLVSLCGEGEWFVGTRGGAADHAAIKLSRRGYVTRVGFFPFQIEDSAPFLPEHDLVVCNSGVYAGKSHQARNTFNEKVTAYHLGRIWAKMLRPDLAPRLQQLRDLNPEHLRMNRASFGQLLTQLPARLSRTKVQAAFAQMAAADRAQIERLLGSHDAPVNGYAVRDVVLFGLSEMARARRCLALLKAGQARELGRLMNISHDGDRVSRTALATKSQKKKTSAADRVLLDWARKRGRQSSLTDLSGAYGCSLPAIDEMVDFALQLPGVEGAQLAGAGLGGCVMALVQRAHTTEVLQALGQQGIRAEVFRPIAGASSLAMG